jgi:fructose-bisphosphate aldolase class II
MLVGLEEILAWAKEHDCAVPAFNVYNMETVRGVMDAAQESKAPVIMQIYSRLFDEEDGFLLVSCAVAAARELKTPVAIHLDHGAGIKEVQRALRFGVSSIMYDGSVFPNAENIEKTRQVVAIAQAVGVQVEGELGHIGTTKQEISQIYTDAQEAKEFVELTGVKALAVMIGNAHGRYPKTPKLNIQRLSEIAEAVDIPLVLHGGTGIPDEQIRQAIAHGVRKVNFGTDVCYAFLDAIHTVDRSIVGIDTYMKEPVKAVRDYALKKIHVLGADK